MTLEDARFDVELYFRGGSPGSFFSALMKAWEHADMWNQMRLADGFPEVEEAIEEYNQGKLKQLAQ